MAYLFAVWQSSHQVASLGLTEAGGWPAQVTPSNLEGLERMGGSWLGVIDDLEAQPEKGTESWARLFVGAGARWALAPLTARLDPFAVWLDTPAGGDEHNIDIFLTRIQAVADDATAAYLIENLTRHADKMKEWLEARAAQADPKVVVVLEAIEHRLAEVKKAAKREAGAGGLRGKVGQVFGRKAPPGRGDAPPAAGAA
jgi:hypothetical protein